MTNANKLSFCLIMIMLFSTLNVFAAQTGTIGEPEYYSALARFERGTYAPIWQVTTTATVNETSFYNGHYTRMINNPSGSGQPQYGTVELVNRARFPGGSLQTIGFSSNNITSVTLKMRLKLDDVRNKDLDVVFSHMVDANFEPVSSGDYSDNSKRMDFCIPNDSSSRYISIAHAIEETTSWQNIEVTLDLSEYTNVTHWNSSYQSMFRQADWRNATAIHIASRKEKNAFSDTSNPATNIEICYGDIELFFNKEKSCMAEIDIYNETGADPINSLTPNAVIVPKASFINETSFYNEGLVMFAVYKDGIMVNLDADIAQISGNSSLDVELPSFTLPADLSGYEVTMFLWSDFIDMQPLTKHLAFKQ